MDIGHLLILNRIIWLIKGLKVLKVKLTHSKFTRLVVCFNMWDQKLLYLMLITLFTCNSLCKMYHITGTLIKIIRESSCRSMYCCRNIEVNLHNWFVHLCVSDSGTWRHPVNSTYRFTKTFQKFRHISITTSLGFLSSTEGSRKSWLGMQYFRMKSERNRFNVNE